MLCQYPFYRFLCLEQQALLQIMLPSTPHREKDSHADSCIPSCCSKHTSRQKSCSLPPHPLDQWIALSYAHQTVAMEWRGDMLSASQKQSSKDQIYKVGRVFYMLDGSKEAGTCWCVFSPTQFFNYARAP